MHLGLLPMRAEAYEGREFGFLKARIPLVVFSFISLFQGDCNLKLLKQRLIQILFKDFTL